MGPAIQCGNKPWVDSCWNLGSTIPFKFHAVDHDPPPVKSKNPNRRDRESVNEKILACYSVHLRSRVTKLHQMPSSEPRGPVLKIERGPRVSHKVAGPTIQISEDTCRPFQSNHLLPHSRSDHQTKGPQVAALKTVRKKKRSRLEPTNRLGADHAGPT